MPILTTLLVALKALGRNKLRTALTMLGMIIGVAAVITMVALGTGAQAAIEDQIKGAGTNMIVIFPGNVAMGGVSLGLGASSKLTPDDAKALRAADHVRFVSEGTQTRQQVIHGDQNWATSIVGVNTDYLDIKSWPLTYGTFFTDDDVRTNARVCLLGVNVAQMLFGDDVDPTDEEIRVGTHIFRVLGVMAPKGASSGGQNQDDQILAPYTTVLSKLQGVTYLSYILAAPATTEEIPMAVSSIADVMRVQHRLDPGADDDFRIQTQDDMIAVRTQATQTMTLLLSCVAAVSLMVGGIGIMNIMLVSVSERTREIGLRMAIGARSVDVLGQFLLEAIVISLIGGCAGIALGFGCSEFITWYAEWPAVIPPNSVFLAFGFAGVVGVFFGFYPAWKAAALDPIAALRFE
jgi:putative ABC transport system permease protein